MVDVARPMEEVRDVKSRVATRELEMVDVAEPMGRDAKLRVATRELKLVDVA